MPGREELPARILHWQPEIDFDEASVIMDNRIASESQIYREIEGSRVRVSASKASPESISRVFNTPSKLLSPSQRGQLQDGRKELHVQALEPHQ